MAQSYAGSPPGPLMYIEGGQAYHYKSVGGITPGNDAQVIGKCLKNRPIRSKDTADVFIKPGGCKSRH